VTLKAIDAPPTEWGSALAPFEDTYKHEQKVTGLINNLVNLAMDERDHATNAMLQWFVTEQVEEEKNASDIVAQIKLLKDAPDGIFRIDRELATRVFVPPVTTEGAAQ
jgi:ferritin